MKSNTFVIGDIHGGLIALKQVLEKAKVTKEDTLIFLGDYVDGWSESSGVISFLIELEQEQSCIFLRGNHDEWCEVWLKTGKMSEVGYEHGGKATMASYDHVDEVTKEKHALFFENMKNYYVDEQNRLFVHAGFTSLHGPQREYHEPNLFWDRTLWEMTAAIDKNLSADSKFFPKRLRLFKEIYIGHTPTTNYDVFQPINIFNLWNIDTGAAFNGSLTILNVETKEFWQSDKLMELYPGEPGRRKA